MPALVLPDDREAAALLRRVGVADEVVPDVLAGRPAEGSAAWATVASRHHDLVATDASCLWPAPAVDAGPVERWAGLWALVAAVPRAFAIDGERDVDPAVTWDTLRDIGIAVGRYADEHGRPGFPGASWLCQHVRGEIYRLGRLQFALETARVDPGPDAPFGPGDPVLGVHIPPSEPLTPAACDESVRRAGPFMRRHVPGPDRAVATCASWLLDEQLRDVLGPGSNIVAFQRRFTYVDGWSDPGDEDVLRFVFGRPHADVASLRPVTTLERAIVAHLAGGGHYRNRLGWFVVP